MVGRLSTYAKNRILNLRFQNNYKIKHIAQTLLQEDNIKVSRESISTFLKKYIDTKSINDKPRSGRNKKLTPEEINLIGEVTRLNRDITAPKIKQYLNLNVSTHTILRASKLFEWNKNNPNSNEAKKAAALERQLNGESKRRSKSYRTKKNANESQQINDSMDASQDETTNKKVGEEEKLNDSHNLNLVTEKEILTIKNISSSPMVFATKILMKLFRSDELHGHNVSGKTFSKNVKNKKALDEKRIKYIRWLVENNFETSNREQLWKMCRTAINKIILINEKKQTKMQLSSNKQEMDGSLNDSSSSTFVNNSYEQKDSSLLLNNSQPVLTILSPTTAPQLGTKTTIVKLNDTEILDDEEDDAEDENEEEENKVKKEFSESNNKRNNSNKFKKSANKEANNKNSEIPISTIRTRNRSKILFKSSNV
jgi:transposase